MIHLCVHLSREAIFAGPVQYQWMYAFERYIHILKGYVRNKARPEGSIAEGYIDNEALTFCSMYFNEGETKFNKPEWNYDGPIKATQDGNIFVFKQKVRGIRVAINDVLNLKDLKKARWYVLNNCDEVQPYVRQYMDELERQGLRNVQEMLESEFHTWFLKYVSAIKF
ncbi:uncharacterized protein LOC114292268 [Camellia sinensis]|uniref:uncharacterized protein LOC114292268 n=1 Tax=Camellia sinensis TaxID=4442 RepID=UPI001036CFA7|nr:uncharacterized protein LOC114292268 [Camellia sinensis]